MRKMFDDTLDTVIQRIAHDYNLDEAVLKEKYHSEDVFPFPVTKPRTKTKVGAGASASGEGGTETRRKKKTVENEADMYIELEQIEVNGESYLHNPSKNGGNKVYTYTDKNPKLVGILLANGEIKKYENSSS